MNRTDIYNILFIIDTYFTRFCEYGYIKGILLQTNLLYVLFATVDKEIGRFLLSKGHDKGRLLWRYMAECYIKLKQK